MIILKNKLIKLVKLCISTNRWTLYYENIETKEKFDLYQPSNVARADNFLIEVGGKIYVFFEEFICEKNRKGYLCVGVLEEREKKVINVKKILEKEYHLSYPNVFEIDGKYYMIPETSNNNTVDLYYFEQFPYKLKKIRTLLNKKCVDSTLLKKDGFFYLLTNEKMDDFELGETLNIYYGKDLLKGEFKLLNNSPVCIGKKYSRMAGNIINENGRIYRFAQDCTAFYGAKIYKFEITKLNKYEYEEKLIEIIDPPKNCIATHTYSKVKNIIIKDVIKRETNIYKIFKNIINILFRNLVKKI